MDEIRSHILMPTMKPSPLLQGQSSSSAALPFQTVAGQNLPNQPGNDSFSHIQKSDMATGLKPLKNKFEGVKTSPKSTLDQNLLQKYNYRITKKNQQISSFWLFSIPPEHPPYSWKIHIKVHN